MSYRQRSIGKIGDFLPTANPENLDESLLHIREAAREYYARKKGTWKPKRDLDAERLEDESRFRRESMDIFGGSLYSSLRMMRYSSGPERMIVHRDLEAVERIRKGFVDIDFSSVEERIRKLMETKRALIPTGPRPSSDMVIIDELPTSSRMPELKDYQHKFLYGEWVDTTKLGAGKNPVAEHTIRAVKKSHRKRRFSQKSK